MSEERTKLNKSNGSVVKELKQLLREMGERPSGGGGMLGEYWNGRREARAEVRKLLRERIKFHLQNMGDI